MPKSLVIVESVAKSKTINRYLGKDFQVLSSVGHIKDLPKGRLGVDINDSFSTEYITIRGKGKALDGLRRAAAASDHVYIATDPDREGEAIAWHIAEEIKPKNPNISRVLFNEITERAVREGIDNPMEIDGERVEAQRARRVLDRLVGYQISPILWKTVFYGLSAGRVQSVALRLVCEREAEIDAFVPREYWSITARLKSDTSDPFLSKLHKIEKKKVEIASESAAQDVVEHLSTCAYYVADIKKKQVQRQPSPPFTTSTLQQEAARRLGFSAKRIMAIAQQLYEGVALGSEGPTGLITYMRTDSTRLSMEAIHAARGFIEERFGENYVPEKPKMYRAKKGAQDAHEAVRPTSAHRTPESLAKFLTKDQLKLYDLIWRRFVACQMENARLEQTTVDIAADKPEEYLFRSTGSHTLFLGFRELYPEFHNDNGNGENGEDYIPDGLEVGAKLALLELLPRQHFTKPPARFSESTLVKELDGLGIGRPSTYAMIISTLLSRKYVEREARQLIPTDLGKTVNRILVQNFPTILNVKFTAEMEAELDQVESGSKHSLDVLNGFYGPFKEALDQADARKDDIKESLLESTNEACPKCGKELVVRWGRNGKFIGCSGYPDCKYTKPVDEAEMETTDEVCDKCGSPMLVKTGRFGRFLACSKYPECKTTKSITIGVACPREGCGGSLVEKRSKRGRVFYGCNKYPECDFASWSKPVSIACPACGNPYLEKRSTQAKGEYLACPKCKAQHDEKSVRDLATAEAG